MPKHHSKQSPIRYAFLLVVLVAGCSDSATSGPADPPPDNESPSVQVGNPPQADLDTAKAFYETSGLTDEMGVPGTVGVEGLIARCVEHFGFPLYDEYGAVEMGVFIHRVGDQSARSIEADKACRQALVEIGGSMPVGSDAHGARYDLWVEVASCLEEHGYPTVSPPTRDTFVENPGSWDPWEGMIDRGKLVVPSPERFQAEEYGEYFRSLQDCPPP